LWSRRAPEHRNIAASWNFDDHCILMPALQVIFEQFLAEPAGVVPDNWIETRLERFIPVEDRDPNAVFT
jgi:hypothetical protein